MDAFGDVLVADTLNNCIRGITPDGQVITVAGSTADGYRDGPARIAQFFQPIGLAFGPANVLYVGDSLNYRVRMVSLSAGGLSAP